MKSNRRHKRFSVDLMNIKGKITVSNMVDVLDMSTDGIKLKTDLRLNIGCQYVVSMENDEQSLKLDGTVESSSISEPVNGSDGDIIPMYTAGMKFDKTSDEVLSVLSYFMDVHNKTEEERLIGVGLHIETLKETSLALSLGYKVKKISLGGILIASGREFTVDSRFPMDITLPGNRHVRFMGRIASCTIISKNVPLPHDDSVTSILQI